MPTITERFNERLGTTPEISGQWQCTLEKFRVPDVTGGSEPSQAWLICESPHTDEVTEDELGERYPLRGQSGKMVTKALIDCGHLDERCGRRGTQSDYIPVGELVRVGVLNSIKIVNVCELPLQSEAYAQRVDQELIDCIPTTLPFKDWAQILRALGTVRKLKVSSRVPRDQPLVCDVLEDFCDRVRGGETGCRVILCGRTARACWRVLGLARENTRCVAHPSRQGWYANQQVKESVRLRLGWWLGD